MVVHSGMTDVGVPIAVIVLEDTSEPCHRRQHVAFGRVELTWCSSSLQATRDLVNSKCSRGEWQRKFWRNERDLVNSKYSRGEWQRKFWRNET